jgi:hypothetical protein
VLEASGTYEDAADGFFFSEPWTPAVDDARQGEPFMPDVVQLLAYAYRQERGRVEGEGWSRGAEEGR